LGGKVSCTLGEVKNRADLIIYWGGNPAECHPRHFTKYTLTQKGKFLPNGRKDRTMVLVDIRETPSAKAADIFLQVRPTKDFEVLTILRALIKDQPVDQKLVEETGLKLEQFTELVDLMKKCKFGVMFFGMGLSMTRGKHMNSAALLTLAAEMNAFTKFVAMPMRGHGNVTGGDVIMRWSTGYPFGVNLCRGYPRFNPGEYSTVDLLLRGDCDAALILGADPGATMPQPAIDHLARIPTIVLDPKVTHTSRISRVHITTAATGISAPGTAYRMDEIPLPLKPALKSPYPTDEEVVRRIREAVAKRPAWVPPVMFKAPNGMARNGVATSAGRSLR
jgi:formylmethanofuran dehydrogenase subunit B